VLLLGAGYRVLTCGQQTAWVDAQPCTDAVQSDSPELVQLLIDAAGTQGRVQYPYRRDTRSGMPGSWPASCKQLLLAVLCLMLILVAAWTNQAADVCETVGWKIITPLVGGCNLVYVTNGMAESFTASITTSSL